MPYMGDNEAASTVGIPKPKPGTIVARWDLEMDAKHEAAMPDVAWFPPNRSEDFDESVFPADKRTLVPPKDFGPGGKYRGKGLSSSFHCQR